MDDVSRRVKQRMRVAVSVLQVSPGRIGGPRRRIMDGPKRVQLRLAVLHSPSRRMRQFRKVVTQTKLRSQELCSPDHGQGLVTSATWPRIGSVPTDSVRLASLSRPSRTRKYLDGRRPANKSGPTRLRSPNLLSQCPSRAEDAVEQVLGA